MQEIVAEFKQVFEQVVITMRLFHQLLLFFSNISDVFEVLIRLPFRGTDTETENQSWLKSLLMLPVKLISIPIGLIGLILLFPIRVFTVFSKEQRREVLWGLPAILVLLFIIAAVSRSLIQSRGITEKYRNRATIALQQNDYELAKTYFGRILASDFATNNDKFNWAISLMNTDEAKRGLSIMDQLAPDSEQRFQLAHRFKALRLAAKESAIEKNEVPLLRFHLQAAGEASGLNKAWYVYYLAIDETQKAIDHLELAADEEPQLLVPVAEFLRQMGSVEKYQRTLRNAKRKLEPLVQQQPESIELRLSLANIENRLENFQEAESLLVKGLKIKDDPDLRFALANFYVNQHDIAVKNNESLEIKLKHIQSALKYDSNHVPAYDRLVFNYRNFDTPNDLAEIREQLEQTIASGKSPALSHFSLSNILWVDGDKEQSQWHMEQAYSHDKGFAVVANNLAWILAHNAPPDLDRAFELIDSVVEQAPEDVRFRDTLATILMKQEKFDKAAVEFEKCLSDVEDKREIHKKLAVIYDKLGRSSLSRIHQEAVSRLESKPN